MLGVLFALTVLAAGWAMCRLLRCDVGLAPALGLAVLAVLSTWCVALGLPPVSAVGAVLVVVGAACLAPQWTTGPIPNPGDVHLGAALIVGVAALVPAFVLGVTFASLDVPISNHDGAFHVERIAGVLQGQDVAPWYPMGFHASLAAVLGLAPWLNSARGVAEAAQGISILAPLAVFGLARRLGSARMAAALAALIQALTFLYPYDFHLWGGWPLGLGVLLALGVWTAALAWLSRPSVGLSIAAGALFGGVLLTHGTELYTAALGLAAIALLRWRSIAWPALARQVPLAGAVAVVVALSYLPRLFGWVQSGGAAHIGVQTLEATVLDPTLQGGGLWIQIGLGVVGASSLLDLPLRVALIGIGVRQPCTTLSRALWLTFVGVLLVMAGLHLPLLDRLYAITFPWLADQRLLQVATIFASVLAARGFVAALDWLNRRRASSPSAQARWVLVAAVVLVAFFGEGSVVSVWKRLDAAVKDEVAFTSDDRAAMAWLREHAPTGARVANDGTADAGIWTPYTAGLPILAPRTTEDAQVAVLLPRIAEPGLVCSLPVRYVYYGARVYGFEERHFSLDALRQASAMREVFTSGGASVFETQC
jgi:hypothetical protein